MGVHIIVPIIGYVTGAFLTLFIANVIANGVDEDDFTILIWLCALWPVTLFVMLFVGLCFLTKILAMKTRRFLKKKFRRVLKSIEKETGQ